VLIPRRNRRHLMLDREVVEAVEQGLFHVHIVDHVTEGIALLTGMSAGEANDTGNYPRDSVLGPCPTHAGRISPRLPSCERHRQGRTQASALNENDVIER